MMKAPYEKLVNSLRDFENVLGMKNACPTKEFAFFIPAQTGEKSISE